MNECAHYERGVCKVATSMAGSEVRAQPAGCAACCSQKIPRAINRVTVGMALAELLRLGKDGRNLMASHGHHINERPTLPLRVISYAAAVAKWMLQGRPVRTQEQVTHLYREVCGRCPEREPTAQCEVSYCGPCGCVLSEDPSVTNKLYFLTEHCPQGKF